jgi:hypothetical protein
MSTPEDLPGQLEQIARLEPVVTLLNEYKGVPVSREALVQSVDTGTAHLAVHKHQAVCLSLEAETVLQSKLLSLALLARVVALDVVTGAATLTDFIPTVYLIGRRQAIRLKPQSPVEVSVENLRLNGRLINLSMSGLGLHLPLPSGVAERDFQMNPDLQIHLQLPTEASRVELAGRVAHSTFRNGAYLLGINLAADAEAQRALENYIAQRQATVTQELETIYNRICADQLTERRQS